MDFEKQKLENIRESIIKFKNDLDFQKLKEFYYTKSFSEILGVSRRELSHSGLIAWLLDSLQSHGLGFFAISKLLDIVQKFSNPTQKNKYNELFNCFVTEDYTIEKLSVTTEHPIKNVGRVDILIELEIIITDSVQNIKIIIENKVESKENNDQTNNYYRHFVDEKSNNDILFFLYLTPIPTLDLIELSEPECNCKEFTQINYQSIVDYLIEPALTQNISQNTKTILIEYLKSLSKPAMDDNSENYKKEIIMALGNEERKLLTSFWTKNQDLIKACLYAISSDPEQEKDVRDSVNDALNNLSSDKDKSRLSVFYNDVLFITQINKADIGLQTVRLLENKNLINKDIIEFLKEDRSAGHSLIKTKEEITDTELKYRRYRVTGTPELIFDGIEYYVVRNWGITNIKQYINKFEAKFNGLKYVIN
jgi:hypothetical protein